MTKSEIQYYIQEAETNLDCPPAEGYTRRELSKVFEGVTLNQVEQIRKAAHDIGWHIETVPARYSRKPARCDVYLSVKDGGAR